MIKLQKNEETKKPLPKSAPLNLDERVLSKLVQTTVQDFMNSGLTEDMLLLDEAKTGFNFIKHYIHTYKVLPSVEILKTNGLTDTCCVDAPEPLKYYMDLIVMRKVHRTFNIALKASSDSLKEKDFTQLASTIGDALLAYQKLTKVQTNVLTSNDMVKVYNSMILEDIECDGITTPWPQANRYGPVLRNGDIGVIAARIGEGKTWTCQVIAHHAQSVQGKKVLFYSLEMPSSELIFRDTAIRNSIDPTQINKKELTTALLKKIKEAKSSNPIRFLGNGEVRSLITVRADINIYQPDFVVIDAAYILGTGITSKYQQSKYDKISTVIQGLRDMAAEFGIPMLLSYQINREGKKTKDKGEAMDLSHIAGSDDIGQLATWVVILDNVEEGATTRGVQIPKTRKGVRDRFTINWNIKEGDFSQADANTLNEEDEDPLAHLKDEHPDQITGVV